MKNCENFYIIGPTASNKSAIAMELAQKINGVILNADSMQIYKDLQLISGAPTKCAQGEIDHRLYGVINSFGKFNVASWLDLVNTEIENLQSKGQNIIICGGTGLYAKAYFNGLYDIGTIDQKIKDKVKALTLDKTVDEIYELAVSINKEFETFLKRDPHRLIRAIEVYLQKGILLKAGVGQSVALGTKFKTHLININVDKAKLWENIEHRLQKLFALREMSPVINEVRNFLENPLSRHSLARKAIGVGEIESYLNGDIDFSEMLAKILFHTRQYSKRQRTFIKTQLSIDFQVCSCDEMLILSNTLHKLVKFV